MYPPPPYPSPPYTLPSYPPPDTVLEGIPFGYLLLGWLLLIVLQAAVLWLLYRWRKRFTGLAHGWVAPRVSPVDKDGLESHSLVSFSVDLAAGERIRVTLEGLPAVQDSEHIEAGDPVPLQVISSIQEAPVVEPLAVAPPAQVEEIELPLVQEESTALEREAEQDLQEIWDDLYSQPELVEDEEQPAPPPDLRSRSAFVQFVSALWLGGIGLILLSQLLGRDVPGPSRAGLLAPTITGLLFFTLGVYTVQKKHLPSILHRILDSLCLWLGVGMGQVVLLVLGLMLALLASAAAGDTALMYSPVLAVLAWIAGMALVVLGGWWKTPYPRLSWQTALCLAGVSILALLTRVVDTAHIPVALSGDEGNAALSAMAFIEGKTNNIFAVGWHSFPSMYYSIQSIFISWFGNTIEALRLPSAVIGALTVAALFLVARVMFGKRTALLAGIFLAAFHYHVHFSRIGLNNVWDSLTYVITLGALWYGWGHQRREYFLLAGLGLGLAQYFYSSSRVLIVIIVAWLLVAGLMDKPRLKRALPHLVLMGLVVLACVLPMVIFYIRHPGDFWGPAKGVSVFGRWLDDAVAIQGRPAWRILIDQLVLGFSAYIYTPIKVWYVPRTAILRAVPAVFFVLGILALRLRDSRSLLLIFWLVGGGFVGGLSESTPAAQRYVAMAPACALLVGYSVDWMAARFSSFWPRQRGWISVAAVLLVVGMAADDIRFYFFQYTPNSYFGDLYDFGGYGTAVAQSLVDYLQDKPIDRHVYFFGAPNMGYYSISSLPYLAPHIKGTDMNHPWGSAENPPIQGDRLFFVFLPGHESDLEGAQVDYPGGKLVRREYIDGELLYYLYEYPPVTGKP